MSKVTQQIYTSDDVSISNAMLFGKGLAETWRVTGQSMSEVENSVQYHS